MAIHNPQSAMINPQSSGNRWLSTQPWARNRSASGPASSAASISSQSAREAQPGGSATPLIRREASWRRLRTAHCGTTAAQGACAAAPALVDTPLTGGEHVCGGRRRGWGVTGPAKRHLRRHGLRIPRYASLLLSACDAQAGRTGPALNRCSSRLTWGPTRIGGASSTPMAGSSMRWPFARG